MKTVQDLINYLQTLPSDLEVRVGGCCGHCAQEFSLSHSSYTVQKEVDQFNFTTKDVILLETD